MIKQGSSRILARNKSNFILWGTDQKITLFELTNEVDWWAHDHKKKEYILYAKQNGVHSNTWWEDNDV